MKHLQRFLMGTGGMALAALVLTLAVPKAAHAIVAALVQVVNTNANPVINSRMDDPGRIPYLFGTNPNITCTNICTFNLPAVPAHHRLVLDHLGGTVPLTAHGFVEAQLNCLNCADVRNNGILVPDTGVIISVFSTPVHLYFDAGEIPQLNLDAGATIIDQAVTVSGYMLDCSAAPCAAIAH